jgi:hypothetical protein
MRRHDTTIGRPREVRCNGCGERIPNTRHPDLERDLEDWCSLACLEGRSPERPGTGERPLVADGGESRAD